MENVNVSLEDKFAMVRDLRVDLNNFRVDYEGYREGNEHLRISIMNKQQDLENALASPAAAVEFNALCEAKTVADNARGVSEEAKDTAIQERDAAVAAKGVYFDREKYKDLT